MADYINPFSGQGDLTSIDSSFLRSYERGNREIQAQPFLDLARNNQNLDLQKKDMELGEWANPTAVAARLAAQQEKLLTSNENMRAIPHETDFRIQKAKDAIRANPAITDQHIAEADLAAMKARGHPAEKFFDEIGSANAMIKQAQSPLAQHALAQNFIFQWQSRHPGAQIPEIMKKYDPTQWDLAEYVALQTREHRQKLELEKAKEEAKIKGLGITGETAREVARITAASREKVSENRPERPGTVTQQLKADHDDLIDNYSSYTPEQRDQIRKKILVNPEYLKLEQKAVTDATNNEINPTKKAAAAEKERKAYQERKGLALESGRSSPTTRVFKPGEVLPYGKESVTVVRTNPDGSVVVRNSKNQEAVASPDQIK